jgi:hypothetical protein
VFSKILRGETEVPKGVFLKEVKEMPVSYKESQKNMRLGDFIVLNETDSEDEYDEF